MADAAESHKEPALIQLPRLGAGIYVRIEPDGTEHVATWDRPEDADAAMRAAGFEDWHG